MNDLLVNARLFSGVKLLTCRKRNNFFKDLVNEGVPPSPLVFCPLSFPPSLLRLVRVCQRTNSPKQLLRKSFFSERNTTRFKVGLLQSSCTITGEK